jgi:isopentenyl-diphosphate Delta-isomerase
LTFSSHDFFGLKNSLHVKFTFLIVDLYWTRVVAPQERQTLLVHVDPLDNFVGLVEKKEAHLLGLLHRAFSIFVFRKIGSSLQLLLQQRAIEKYHSGGLWTNTCCSHAEPECSLEVTAHNRLQAEMGFSCPLDLVDSVYYKVDVGNGMIEHEIDYIFAAFHNPINICINLKEVSDFRWVDVSDVKKSLTTEPEKFTAWFPIALETALKFSPQRGECSIRG